MKLHIPTVREYLTKIKKNIFPQNKKLQDIFDQVTKPIEDKTPEVIVLGPTGGGKSSIVSYLVGKDVGISASVSGSLFPKSYKVEITKGDPDWTITDTGGFGGSRDHKKAMELLRNRIKTADLILFVCGIEDRATDSSFENLKELLTIVKRKESRDIPIIFVGTKTGKINGISKDILDGIDWDNYNNSIEYEKHRAIINKFLQERIKDFASKNITVHAYIPVDCYIPEKSNWTKYSNSSDVHFWNMDGLIDIMAKQASLATRAMYWRLLLERHVPEKKFIDKLIKHVIDDTSASRLIGRQTRDAEAKAFIAIAMQYLPSLIVLWTTSHLKITEAENIFNKMRPKIVQLFIKHKVKIIPVGGKGFWGLGKEEKRVDEYKTIDKKFLDQQLRLSLKLYRMAFIDYAYKHGLDIKPSIIDRWPIPKAGRNMEDI